MDSAVDIEVVQHLLEFVEQTPDLVAVSDPWGRILYLNPAARKRLGRGDEMGLTLAEILPPEEIAFYYEVVRPQLIATGAWSGEILVDAAGAEPVPMYVCTTGRIGPGGETNGGVIYARDVSNARAFAMTAGGDVDATTGLLTKAAFDERMQVALGAARRAGDACALLVAEIALADEERTPVEPRDWNAALAAVGRRLASVTRSTDFVGRIDERRFALLIPGIRGHSEVLRLSRMIAETLEPAITTAGGQLTLAVGCGAALGQATDTPDTLLERARATVDWPVAGHPGRDDRGDEGKRSSAGVTQDELGRAMSQGHILPFVQPVCDLRTGEPIAFQAVVRWQHPMHGLLDYQVAAQTFAESPVTAVIDRYAARETAAAVLLATPPLQQGFYVPVSLSLVSDVRTEQHFREIADAFCLALESIHLQLPADRVVSWPTEARHALRSLREAGIRLVASGVDSLTAVRSAALAEFDEVELAASLTSAVGTDAQAGERVRLVAGAAHDNGQGVFARGVRDDTERIALLEAGCNVGTGPRFGAAVRADAVE